jgi:16S rRNA C967 or C1407 C5-methylase (RsmB/RsmF family)/NOL1/NOP2/fmu family ribosome biogenesis protein
MDNYVLPEDFSVRMRKRLGERYPEFEASLSDAAPVSIRLNPAKWRGDSPDDQVPWCSTGYYLKKRPLFTADPWFHGGVYYVQEAASMFLEQAFRQLTLPDRALVLDLCGAPGGKSTHLLSLLRPDDMLVSNEVIRSRTVVLRENISKWGNPGVVVTQNDPKDFAGLPPLFNLVVADAPCSGEGLFRKDRAAMTEWSLNNAAHCAARQKRILADAWNCLKPGGYLIYSTCTFNPAENEENMAWLTGQTGASPVELSPRPEWNIETIRCESVTGYQFSPDRTRGEGFFMAVVRKQGDPANFPHRRLTLRNWQMASKSVTAALENWILPGYDFAFLGRQNDYFIFPAEWISTLDVLEKYLRILQPGTQVAAGVGNGFNPHPELAHSLVVNQTSFLSRSVDLPEAIGFLRKDNLSAGTSEKGWVLVSYRGIPLGWLKNLGTRSNNYFPAERRIRMNITGMPQPWHEQIFGV